MVAISSPDWELSSYTIIHGSFFLQHSRLDVREVKAESVRASVIKIFWDEDLIVRKLLRLKKENSDVEKEGLLTMQFHLIVVLILLKTHVKDCADC